MQYYRWHVIVKHLTLLCIQYGKWADDPTFDGFPGDGLNKELIPYLLRFSFASDIKYIDKEMNTTFKVFDGFTLYINDNKNKEEIKNKLLKEIERLESEIKRSEGLLHNQNFISKAPKAKIDLETEKAQRRIAQLEAEVERQKKINELLKKVDALERKLL